MHMNLENATSRSLSQTNSEQCLRSTSESGGLGIVNEVTWIVWHKILLWKENIADMDTSTFRGDPKYLILQLKVYIEIIS